jgi:hypothetical protein
MSSHDEIAARQLDIEMRLRGQVEEARRKYDSARAEFASVIKDLPNGIPQSDGDLLIRQTGAASREALHNYHHAVRRFADFAMSGRVPDDLLRVWRGTD